MIIKTKEQFQKVLSHPRFYGLLSHVITVDVTYDVEEKYLPLVNAMKVKSRYKRLAYIFDEACDRIDQYNVDNHLLCAFTGNQCDAYGQNGKVNGCCYHCRYQSGTGCPTRNLTCKFYFCDRMRRGPVKPLTFQDFPEFRLLSLRQKYMIKNNPYCTRETCLRLMWLKSFLIFFLYSTRKVFDMDIAERKNRKM